MVPRQAADAGFASGGAMEAALAADGVPPGGLVYLAPGWTYHLENTGAEPAFFVYSMTPAPE